MTVFVRRECFQHVGHENPINQKTRCACTGQRKFPNLRNERQGSIEDLRISGVGSNHFNQRHAGNRIKKVYPDQSAWFLQWRGNVFDSNARRIRRQYRARLGACFNILEQSAFRIQIFDDRLDDDIGVGNPVARDVANEAPGRVCRSTGRLETLSKQSVCSLKRGPQVFFLAVLHGDPQSLKRRPRCDIAAHDACTDDMNAFDCSAFRRQIPQSFAQQE